LTPLGQLRSTLRLLLAWLFSPSVVLPSLSASGTPGACHPPSMQLHDRCVADICHPCPAHLLTSLLAQLLQLTGSWTISRGPCLIFCTYSWTCPLSSSQVSDALCRIPPRFLSYLGVAGFLNCCQRPLV